jgi:glycosyltransferase involved in cell wall biosynthesis
MRVLFYRMNCGFNGVTTWMADLGTGLKERGVEVSYWFGGGTPDRAEPFERIGHTRIGPVAELLAVLEREEYDVVQCATGDRWSLALTLPRMKAKLVATNHGSVSHVWNSGNCHALTAVSHDMVALEQPYTDLAVDLIYVGIGTDRFSIPERFDTGAPIIAWIGRAKDIKQKDFAKFTRVAALLKAKGFRIWVADGSGGTPEEFRGEGYAALDYDRWSRLTMTEIPEFYRAVAASGGAVLMTSRYEALGLVAIEAAAAGAPTIGTDVLGLREAIRPEFGTTFSHSMADDEVARLVVSWLEAHPASVAQSQARAESVTAQFSLATMTERYLAVYRRSSPVIVTTKAVLPDPLPFGASDWIDAAATPTERHRGLWPDIARELAERGEGSLALRAVRMAVRNDPAVVVRPRDLLHLGGSVARGFRGSRRSST